MVFLFAVFSRMESAIDSLSNSNDIINLTAKERLVI
jgi:hypothetical protein